MKDSPDVSVVMSVHNGAPHLSASMDSILSQEGLSLELIAVNDGSTDESRQILEEFASRDHRVRVSHQENQGLTRALVNGCALAQGKYIARQDVGDQSLPGKLAKQLEVMSTTPDASFVSCSTRYVGPNGEYLYEIRRDTISATSRLLTLRMEEIQGPSCHPSTMFPRALYERIGGYRSFFYFAQDLDLWIRLAEQGRHIVMPEVLYEAAVTAESLSGLYRKEQIQTARIILECAKLRRQGRSEEEPLQSALSIKPSAKRRKSRLGRAKALYFIGVCLKTQRDPQARRYFRLALQAFPLHLKSAARLLFW